MQKKFFEKPTNDSSKPSVYIVGGGMGGCMTALKFLNNGWKVILIEKSLELLSGSSDRTPGRLGLGYHYKDLETAKQLMHNTFEFISEFVDELPVVDNTKGQYLIVDDPIESNSNKNDKATSINEDPVMLLYEEISQEYKNFVRSVDKSDPKRAKLNKKIMELFGPPLDFCRKLGETEYNRVANSKIIKFAFQTQEILLDWPALKKIIISKLETFRLNGLLEIRMNTSLVRTMPLKQEQYQLVLLHNNNVSQTIVNYWVNCTWHNTEIFDNQVELNSNTPVLRYNRLKVLAEVKVPSKLKSVPSMFFAFGPHCMMSNYGNGYAKLTYAPVTNAANFTDLYIPRAWQALYDGKFCLTDCLSVLPKLGLYFEYYLFQQDSSMNEYCTLMGTQYRKNLSEEVLDNELKSYVSRNMFMDWDPQHIVRLYYGSSIIKGVSKYIPGMSKATLANLKVGIVKTYGENMDINDPTSDIHRRRESGVQGDGKGYVKNDCMKLINGPSNARDTFDLITKFHNKRIINITQADLQSQDHSVLRSDDSFYQFKTTDIEAIGDCRRSLFHCLKKAYTDCYNSDELLKKDLADKNDILEILKLILTIFENKTEKLYDLLLTKIADYISRHCNFNKIFSYKMPLEGAQRKYVIKCLYQIRSMAKLYPLVIKSNQPEILQDFFELRSRYHSQIFDCLAAANKGKAFVQDLDDFLREPQLALSMIGRMIDILKNESDLSKRILMVFEEFVRKNGQYLDVELRTLKVTDNDKQKRSDEHTKAILLKSLNHIYAMVQVGNWITKAIQGSIFIFNDLKLHPSSETKDPLPYDAVRHNKNRLMLLYRVLNGSAINPYANLYAFLNGKEFRMGFFELKHYALDRVSIDCNLLISINCEFSRADCYLKTNRYESYRKLVLDELHSIITDKSKSIFTLNTPEDYIDDDSEPTLYL